jgi:hypothetical protein
MPEPLQRALGVIRIQARVVVVRRKRYAAIKLVCVVPEIISSKLLADFLIGRPLLAAG